MVWRPSDQPWGVHLFIAESSESTGDCILFGVSRTTHREVLRPSSQQTNMKAPSRKRPLRRTVASAPSGVDLNDIATQVRYVGSAEHKSFLSFAGPPALRSDASRCDPLLADPDELTEWLRLGIRGGYVGGQWEGGFPRYVWYKTNDACYEARLVNRGSGEYKGYPLQPEDCPVVLG